MTNGRPIRFGLIGAMLVVTAACGGQPGPSAPSPSGPVSAAQPAPEQKPACRMSAGDEEWVTSSLKAWQDLRSTALGMAGDPEPDAFFFDAQCVYTASPLMLSKGVDQFDTAMHHDEIHLPDGKVMPPIISTFAAPNPNTSSAFFVMSTPTVWQAGGVKSGLDLGTFMTSVLIHEMSHTAHLSTYMKRVTAIEKAHPFDPELNDDIVQRLMEGDTKFSDAVKRETDLLLAAAAAPTDAQARELARQALASIDARHDVHFVGERAVLIDLEDLFLTLEGAGQWAGYSWLIMKTGGGFSPEVALKEFGMRSRWWSQNEGLALFLVLDRLDDDWVETVYGSGEQTVLELIRAAVAE